MSIFMVERNLKGAGKNALASAQKAAIATVEAMRSTGQTVRYIRSTFVPEDGRCICLFEGESADQVKSLNDAAGPPYHRIAEVLDLNPQ